MSLEDIREFIYFTEASNYQIRLLNIQGAGEPLLWKNLDEGISLLEASKAIENIQIITNGLHLEHISDTTLQKIDRLRVSNYGSFSITKEVEKKLSFLKGDALVFRRPLFCKAPKKEDEPATLPGICISPGPTIVEKKVYLACTPPVFDAMALSGLEPDPRSIVNLELNYLHKYSTDFQGKMPICSYCTENSNRRFKFFPHERYATQPTRCLFSERKQKKDLLNALCSVIKGESLCSSRPYSLEDISNERRAACEALKGTCLNSEEIYQMRQNLSFEPDAGVRLLSLELIANLYENEKVAVVDYFLEALNDPQWEIAFTAVEMMGYHLEILSEEVIQHLVSVAIHSDKQEDYGAFLQSKIFKLLEEVGIEIPLREAFTYRQEAYVTS